MNRASFVKIIDELREANDLVDKIDELMQHSKQNIKNDFMNASSLQISHEDTVVALLEEVLNDDEETICWWVYECDYGREEPIITFNDGENERKFVLDTPEKLYDFLMGGK